MKMIDFTHTKRPDFIQLVLIIAVACLALGAITPAASAFAYEDLSYSSGEEHPGLHVFDGFFVPSSNNGVYLNGIGSMGLEYKHITYSAWDWNTYAYTATLGQCLSLTSKEDASYDYCGWMPGMSVWIHKHDESSNETSFSIDMNIFEWFSEYTNLPLDTRIYFLGDENEAAFMYPQRSFHYSTASLTYSPESLDISLTAFAPDNPSGMYVLSLDGSLIEDTTYTVGINRYTSEFKYLVDSYAYTDGSGSYTFTGSRSLTLPIYYNSFTNMPYSYEVSVNVNDENGYLDKRYLVYWSDLGGLYDTVPEPLVPTPTPTVTFVPPGPVVPSDIIPDPEELNDTVNVTGWYQDQGFLSNSITSPIYSGLDGFFTDSIIPIYDFFLVPVGSLASMITDSVDTSRDAITDSADQLSSYAAPFNTVGGYVVLLVPDVVWVVVFAALSIGYVVLLIRISTGSIKDTIGRFLVRW